MPILPKADAASVIRPGAGSFLAPAAVGRQQRRTGHSRARNGPRGNAPGVFRSPFTRTDRDRPAWGRHSTRSPHDGHAGRPCSGRVRLANQHADEVLLLDEDDLPGASAPASTEVDAETNKVIVEIAADNAPLADALGQRYGIDTVTVRVNPGVHQFQETLTGPTAICTIS
ncbi:hypothetical protein [Streptomyces sp. NPDC001621]|uniref:hypothetical protein n=1 Tax=Streptomyces sp. NPDC001621 TaxID=3364594 RepID=UPI0036BEEF3A